MENPRVISHAQGITFGVNPPGAVLPLLPEVVLCPCGFMVVAGELAHAS